MFRRTVVGILDTVCSELSKSIDLEQSSSREFKNLNPCSRSWGLSFCCLVTTWLFIEFPFLSSLHAGDLILFTFVRMMQLPVLLQSTLLPVDVCLDMNTQEGSQVFFSVLLTAEKWEMNI